MNFSTSTFYNDRNNLIIFSLTSYHILEDQSWLLSSEELDYEVSMEPKQSHRCLIFYNSGIRKAVRHARMTHKATKWPIIKILTGPVMRPDRTKLVKYKL